MRKVFSTSSWGTRRTAEKVPAQKCKSIHRIQNQLFCAHRCTYLPSPGYSQACTESKAPRSHIVQESPSTLETHFSRDGITTIALVFVLLLSRRVGRGTVIRPLQFRKPSSCQRQTIKTRATSMRGESSAARQLSRIRHVAREREGHFRNVNLPISFSPKPTLLLPGSTFSRLSSNPAWRRTRVDRRHRDRSNREERWSASPTGIDAGSAGTLIVGHATLAPETRVESRSHEPRGINPLGSWYVSRKFHRVARENPRERSRDRTGRQRGPTD